MAANWLRIRKSNMMYLWQTMTSVHLSVVPCLWRGKLWLINGFGPRVFPTDVQSTIKFTIPTYQQIEGYYKYLQIVPAWCMLNKPHWGGFTCGFWSPGGGPSAESARSDSSGFVTLPFWHLPAPASDDCWWTCETIMLGPLQGMRNVNQSKGFKGHVHSNWSNQMS